MFIVVCVHIQLLLSCCSIRSELESLIIARCVCLCVQFDSGAVAVVSDSYNIW